jgi:membrane-bound ClpP family serine protease
METTRIEHLLISFFISLALVGFLVGIAYLHSNVVDLGVFGIVFMMIGVVVLIPPGLIYMPLSGLGLMPELRGRESFIQLNPWLWIFCVVFYTFVIYKILRRRKLKKEQQTQDATDVIKKSDALKRHGIIK